MHLIQILLPLYDNEGRSFARELYDQVRRELTDRFGGLTSYVRSPAMGVWKDSDHSTVRDDIVIYEVMVESLDRSWWQGYRAELAARYKQDALVVRASAVELL